MSFWSERLDSNQRPPAPKACQQVQTVQRDIRTGIDARRCRRQGRKGCPGSFGRGIACGGAGFFHTRCRQQIGPLIDQGQCGHASFQQGGYLGIDAHGLTVAARVAATFAAGITSIAITAAAGISAIATGITAVTTRAAASAIAAALHFGYFNLKGGLILIEDQAEPIIKRYALPSGYVVGDIVINCGVGKVYAFVIMYEDNGISLVQDRPPSLEPG